MSYQPASGKPDRDNQSSLAAARQKHDHCIIRNYDEAKNVSAYDEEQCDCSSSYGADTSASFTYIPVVFVQHVYHVVVWCVLCVHRSTTSEDKTVSKYFSTRRWVAIRPWNGCAGGRRIRRSVMSWSEKSMRGIYGKTATRKIPISGGLISTLSARNGIDMCRVSGEDHHPRPRTAAAPATGGGPAARAYPPAECRM